MQNSKKAAAFFDRDGVICEYVEELTELSQFRLRPHIAVAIQQMNQAGYLVIVVTNQPNVAKGKMSMDELLRIHGEMAAQLKAQGALIDHIYFCPHRTQEGGGIVPEFTQDCDCRKPKVGMLQQAAKEFSIDLKESFLIGDTWVDLECADNFGIRGYMVKGGGGYPYAAKPDKSKRSPEFHLKPKYLFSDALEAVKFHLKLL